MLGSREPVASRRRHGRTDLRNAGAWYGALTAECPEPLSGRLEFARRADGTPELELEEVNALQLTQELVRRQGIENLIVALGSNNALGRCVRLESKWWRMNTGAEIARNEAEHCVPHLRTIAEAP
jgi:hypothetical protein